MRYEGAPPPEADAMPYNQPRMPAKRVEMVCCLSPHVLGREVHLPEMQRQTGQRGEPWNGVALSVENSPGRGGKR